ncbi:MAG: hypothetical protein AAFX79_02810 [Planctomycetota bacterium]
MEHEVQQRALRPQSASTEPSILSRRLAPEDVGPGQHVAVLMVRKNYWWRPYGGEFERLVLPWWPECDTSGEWEPWGRAGTPLRIEAVSLPYVVVSRGKGKRTTIDLRQVELVEVGETYAAAFRPKKERKAKSTPATQISPSAKEWRL